MKTANWIKSATPVVTSAPVFVKSFSASRSVRKATLEVTARGVYEAFLNGIRVGNEYMMPGWTSYEKRIQVRQYDVTDMLSADNCIEIQLTNGWYFGRISGRNDNKWVEANKSIAAREPGIIAELTLEYSDGGSDVISTDSGWHVFESGIRSCDIYDGIVYDAGFEPVQLSDAVVCDNNDRSVLIKQAGEPVTAHERVMPVAVINTPNGETVLDFGQNLTGTLQISLTAARGDEVSLSFGEILDKDGNFYNANYRTAKSVYRYICKQGEQTWHPTTTFYGFRYVRVDRFPGSVSGEQFTAIVLHSDMRRTGNIVTSSPMLNRLFSNIIWGQKSNFLDVPTDCPQRDERLGWTGDAQIFMRTASYNFDVQRFFRKWLVDLKLEQRKNGEVPPVIPAVFDGASGAAWGDAVTICPWQMYLTYGDKEILKTMFSAMKKWVDGIGKRTTVKYLWTGGWHYGDWLELNAVYGQCKGKTRDDIVASAYYAYSTQLICKTGRILGRDVSAYEELYGNIVRTFKKTFKDDFKTQTEHVVALYFNLTDKREKVIKSLVRLIKKDGTKIQTGFVGTPYILHVLSDNGYSELAYDLLLRKDYPSWLYPITRGATTIWEHWDGIMPNGDIWPTSMNSYNHYAYGAVADWMYGVCAGINTVEEHPGFDEIRFEPVPTDKLESFSASIETRYGTVSSRWWHDGGDIRYEIITPSKATAIIAGKTYSLEPGSYRF